MRWLFLESRSHRLEEQKAESKRLIVSSIYNFIYFSAFVGWAIPITPIIAIFALNLPFFYFPYIWLGGLPFSFTFSRWLQGKEKRKFQKRSTVPTYKDKPQATNKEK